VLLEEALIWNPGNLVVGPAESERVNKFKAKFDQECYQYLQSHDKTHANLIDILKELIKSKQRYDLKDFLILWIKLVDYGFTIAPWKENLKGYYIEPNLKKEHIVSY
jgi:hypothetical protein